MPVKKNLHTARVLIFSLSHTCENKKFHLTLIHESAVCTKDSMHRHHLENA